MKAIDPNAIPADAKLSTLAALMVQASAARMMPIDGGDARLKDHRAGDVAQRQRVLTLAYPDQAVELLGQLGGDGRDDQRQQGRVEAAPVATRSTASTNTTAPPRSARATRSTCESRCAGAARRGQRPPGVKSTEAQRREIRRRRRFSVRRWRARTRRRAPAGRQQRRSAGRTDRQARTPPRWPARRPRRSSGHRWPARSGRTGMREPVGRRRA